jgi:two-component system response regulator (stage 0 sporulation protein A)
MEDEDGMADISEHRNRRRVIELLSKYGIPAHTKGFRYLVEAVEIVVENPEAIDLITKCIYPDIAKRHHATPASVGKAMERAIKAAWNSGITPPRKLRMSNGEFIATLAYEMDGT